MLAIPEFHGNWTRESVIGEIEVLEPGDVADGRRKGTREIVTVEEDAVEGSGIEELNRDEAIKTVAVEIESPQIRQAAELGGDVAAEILGSEGNPDNARLGESSDIHAGNAGPLAGGGVGVVPVGESGGVGWLVNGGFYREKGETVRGKRKKRAGAEEEEDKEKREDAGEDRPAHWNHVEEAVSTEWREMIGTNRFD